jgi:hypothetical protein
LASDLLESVDADRVTTRARERFNPPSAQEPEESQYDAAESDVIQTAIQPFFNADLRQRIVNVRRAAEQLIDEVTSDRLPFAGADPQAAQAAARTMIDNFEQFVADNREEIEALQILYSQPLCRVCDYAEQGTTFAWCLFLFRAGLGITGTFNGHEEHQQVVVGMAATYEEMRLIRQVVGGPHLSYTHFVHVHQFDFRSAGESDSRRVVRGRGAERQTPTRVVNSLTVAAKGTWEKSQNARKICVTVLLCVRSGLIEERRIVGLRTNPVIPESGRTQCPARTG